MNTELNVNVIRLLVWLAVAILNTVSLSVMYLPLISKELYKPFILLDRLISASAFRLGNNLLSIFT